MKKKELNKAGCQDPVDFPAHTSRLACLWDWKVPPVSVEVFPYKTTICILQVDIY